MNTKVGLNKYKPTYVSNEVITVMIIVTVITMTMTTTTLMIKSIATSAAKIKKLLSFKVKNSFFKSVHFLRGWGG